MGPSRRHVLPICLALLAGMATAAHAQVVTLNTGGQQVRIAVDDEAVLPADFPGDVALPEGRVLVRVERSAIGTTLDFDLAGGVDESTATLDAGMRANGWRRANAMPPATGLARAWEKDGRAVVAWLAPGPDGTRLQLQLLQRR